MNHIRTSALALAVAVLVFSAGCATHGRDFDVANVSKLQPQSTRLSDAIEILGSNPTQRVTVSGGAEIYTWQFIRATGFGVVSNRSITLLFDRDGRLDHVQHLINVPLPEDDRRRLRVRASTEM